MRKIAARLGGLAAVLIAFAGLFSAAAAPVAALPGHLSTAPRLAGCGGPSARPPVYDPVCNDGKWTIVALYWTTWGGGTARGSGQFITHDCAPSCGQGRVALYPVDLLASRVQGGHYTRLEFVFPHHVPKGFSREWVIAYSAGSWHGRGV
jgi:hypothetical protein